MKAGKRRSWLPGFVSKSVPLFASNWRMRNAVRPNPYRKRWDGMAWWNDRIRIAATLSIAGWVIVFLVGISIIDP